MTSTGGGLETIGTLPDLRLPSVRGFGISEQVGAATVDYPLTLPPGPGGFAPSLAISYSSAAVDDIQGEEAGRDSNRYQSGLLGLGWDISGIARQSPADWEVCWSPTCTPGPGKALARVISISGIGPSGYIEVRRPGPWSAPNDWYQSPASSHLTFTVDGDNSLHTGRWETHFSTITDTNGTRYQFFMDSKTFTCADIDWERNTCTLEVLGSVHVGRITNVWGQEINFQYASEWGTIRWNGTTSLGYTKYVRPMTITYGVAQTIMVNFVYFGPEDQRNPGEYYYCPAGGTRVRCDRGRGSTMAEHQDHFTDYLLKQIKVSVDGQLVRTYDLDYYTGAWNWRGGYYDVTELGVQSYHALLKSITERVCHREGSTDVCVEAAPPHTFTYQQLPYDGITATKNDILLTEVNNGYNGRVQFFYDDDDDFSTYTPRAYHVVTFKEDGSTVSGDHANRWRFIVTEKRVFDGKGQRYDILYRYFRHPLNRADGFVDVGEAAYRRDLQPIDMPFRFLGFLRSEVETYDFVGEHDPRPPNPLHVVVTGFYHSLESYQGTQLVCYRPDPRAPSALYVVVQVYENGQIVQQPSVTQNLYHFSRSASGEYDKCEKRLADPRTSNNAFVREPLPLLVQTTITTTTPADGGSVATKTEYEYAWDFTQTGHQPDPNHRGGRTRTLEHGRLDRSGDERTTIAYYAHNQVANIFNKVSQRCIVPGVWPRDTGRGCQPGDRNTYYYYDGQGYGQVGNRGALTKTEVDVAQGVYHVVVNEQDYDPYGNVWHSWDANHNPTTWTYDPVFHALPQTETNALGHTTTVTYDSDPASGASTRWGLPIAVDGPTQARPTGWSTGMIIRRGW